MLRVLAAALVVAFGLTFAAQAQADEFRLPKSGDPALVVNAATTDWDANYDSYGNLQFFLKSKAAAVQLSMIDDPNVATTSVDDLAAQIFKAAGAPPFNRHEAGSIAGRKGDAFMGVMMAGSVPLDMRVVLVKLDARHCAVVSTLKTPNLPADQDADLAGLLAGVRITNP